MQNHVGIHHYCTCGYTYLKMLIIWVFVWSNGILPLQLSHVWTLHSQKSVNHPDENLGLLCTVIVHA